MGLISVIVAALAAFAAGAGYYMSLSKPWVEASGVPTDDKGQPQNGSDPILYLTSFVCIVLVAGMMRHTFALSDIDTVGKGIVSGVGIGAFFISPWIFLNNAYSMRPRKLAVIDSGYAILACAVIGLVLTLFGGGGAEPAATAG